MRHDRRHRVSLHALATSPNEKPMEQETVGNVEFTTGDERLTLRYTRRFIRRAALAVGISSLWSRGR